MAVIVSTPDRPGATERPAVVDDCGSLRTFGRAERCIAFLFAPNAFPAIDVNDMQQFQSMDGFGFALTGGSAQLLMRMEPGPRADLLKELFAPAAEPV